MARGFSMRGKTSPVLAGLLEQPRQRAALGIILIVNLRDFHRAMLLTHRKDDDAVFVGYELQGRWRGDRKQLVTLDDHSRPSDLVQCRQIITIAAVSSRQYCSNNRR